jgi:hypothetical protein
MNLLNAIKDLFVTPSGKASPNPPTLEDIRKKVFETSRNLEIRNREAADAEAKAQAALQKTFQPGLSMVQRQKLLDEHRNGMRNAKRLVGFANQLGSVLDTLENAEAFLELSETISKSDVAGAGRLNVNDLMQELQDTQAALLPMIEECRRMKESMDLATEQFDKALGAEESAEQNELMALYAKYDAEKDPVKKAEIQVEIQRKSEAMLAPALA